jgi:RND superfamily putative drug exporter
MSRKPAGGIAARAGRWSARHKKTAIFGWFALVALSLVFGGSVVREEPTTAQQFNGESRAAEEIREEAGFPEQDRPIETILVQSKQHTVDDPAFKAAVGALEAAVKGQPLVKSVDSSPYGKAPIISRDGHSALIEFELKGSGRGRDRRRSRP